MLGVVHGDQLVAAAAKQPVVGVTPLLKYSPAILMWDPNSHPDWRTVTDIGKSDATVVVSKDQIFPQWMVGKGLLKADQIDTTTTAHRRGSSATRRSRSRASPTPSPSPINTTPRRGTNRCPTA